MSESEVFTVVGTAKNMSVFEKSIEKYIEGNFKILGTMPLDEIEEEEARRFLSYVDAEESASEGSHDVLIELLESVGFEVVRHSTPQEAVQWSNDTYGESAYSSFMTPLKAMDVYRRDVFLGLVHTGEVTMVRAVFNDQPCFALCHHAQGYGSDNLMVPLALLVDENLGSQIELPFKSIYDKDEE